MGTRSGPFLLGAGLVLAVFAVFDIVHWLGL